MNRGERILALMHELERMPEQHLLAELQGLDVSIYTFDRNFADLCRVISFLSDDPRAEPLFWLKNRDQLMSVLRDVIRLLHNLVASAISLIDHTRRLHRKLYASSGEFSDYQSRVDHDFARDPLAQFVKCLRQYCQHYKAPQLDITVSWRQGDEKPTRTVNLLARDLQTFDDWTAEARKYLDTIQEKIGVLTVATDYRNKVIGFYEWFQSRQQEIHSEEIERFRAKERELVLLMLEDKIDAHLAQSDKPHHRDNDEIFLSIFTSKEFAELDQTPRDSPQRASRAIVILDEMFLHVPSEIKQNIMRLYQESPLEE